MLIDPMTVTHSETAISVHDGRRHRWTERGYQLISPGAISDRIAFSISPAQLSQPSNHESFPCRLITPSETGPDNDRNREETKERFSPITLLHGKGAGNDQNYLSLSTSFHSSHHHHHHHYHYHHHHHYHHNALCYTHSTDDNKKTTPRLTTNKGVRQGSPPVPRPHSFFAPFFCTNYMSEGISGEKAGKGGRTGVSWR